MKYPRSSELRWEYGEEDVYYDVDDELINDIFGDASQDVTIKSKSKAAKRRKNSGSSQE